MARANVGINELMTTLQKSGAPFGDSNAMQQASPFLRPQISQQVYGQDTQIPDYKAKYKANLDRIAQMDQKLQSLYGDPSSNLYIENPLTREKLKAGASQTGYKEANSIEGDVKTRQSDLEKQIDEILTTYNKLETLQAREERRQAKEVKSAKSAKTGRTSKQEEAHQKASQKEYQQHIDKLLKATGRDVTNKANIADDQKARDLFLSKPKAFQTLFIRHVLESKQAPKGGFSARDIEANFKEYTKNYGTKAQKSQSTTRQPLF